MSDIVRCERVGHTYGTGTLAVVAVHDATCVVPTGARIALTGPSGSGKSTLLHMMAGLERVTSGTLTWPAFDNEPRSRPGVIGMIFQGPSLIPELNVVENVALPLILDGMSGNAAQVRAVDALEQLDLGWMGARLPDELSGGQAQRAAIARVLCTRPALILADEPTGQLDHESGQHVVDVLLNAAGQLDAALVISTHDTEISMRIGEQWQLHDGRLTTESGVAPGSDPSMGPEQQRRRMS